MNIVATVAVALIAVLHVYILIIEMFLWDKPKGIKVFNLDPAFAKSTTVLAANQGLYNGFLAAALIAGLIIGGATGSALVIYGLLCVMVAGVYGALTAGKKIIFIQTVPATIALALWLLTR